MVEKEKSFKLYAFVELKTPIYKLFFDFDFKEKDDDYNKYANQSKQIVDYIIGVINKTLKKVFEQPDIRFIYCDKNFGKGIHLYYPNIYVSQTIHKYIYNTTLTEIINKNKFNLTLDNWTKIYDACIGKSSNGVTLRMPFFYINNGYYKPNYEESTFNVPEDKYKILQICKIRSDKTEPYPKLKIEINEDIVPVKKTKLKKDDGRKLLEILNEPLQKSIITKVPINELDAILSCFTKIILINMIFGIVWV